jgi:hypothetical protein
MKLRECKNRDPILFMGMADEAVMVFPIIDGVPGRSVLSTRSAHEGGHPPPDPDTEVIPLVPAPQLAVMQRVCEAAERWRRSPNPSVNGYEASNDLCAALDDLAAAKKENG